MKNTHLSVESISLSLYRLDPMNTCCKENDCTDEYDQVAGGIMNRLIQGSSIHNALSYEFLYWFHVSLSAGKHEELVQHLSLQS